MPTPGGNSRWVRAGLRWAGLAAVFALTLEVSARVEDAVVWGAPLAGPYSHAHLMSVDSLGPHNRPGYRFEKWSINSSGFRGPEVAPRPAPGVTRVGVLGASETFGLFEREGWEYPARLQAVLDSLTPGGFEVVNFGMAGMSLPAMRDYFERRAAPLGPELVLIYATPSFYLFEAPPSEWGTPLTDAEAPRSRLPAPRLVTRAHNALRRFIPGELQVAVRERGLDEVREAQGPDWLWREVPTDRIEHFATDLENLVRTVRQAGSRPVLVTHSNRFRQPRAEMTADDERHMMAILRLHPRATPEVMAELDDVANEVIRELGSELAVPVIETEGRIPASAEYFADYSHFTDAGADLMARILAEGLLSLDPGPS